MPNAYFQFKQFRVEQANCAMKISTDACIFGSYLPVNQATNIIDIGTGTGLLALMVAQRSDACIDAIEIEAGAVQEATKNCQASAWADRIKVYHSSIQQFAAEKQAKGGVLYDMVICNPPFFDKATLPPSKAQQLAHHTVALSFQDLWQCAITLLIARGRFAVLLPLPEMDLFEQIGLTKNFIPTETLFIQDSAKKSPHRKVVIFEKYDNTKQSQENKVTHLLIKHLDGSYSPDFIKLLQPYYMYL
jgi:tRNA1Val (adenine37-N6)-methyltransferase